MLDVLLNSLLLISLLGVACIVLVRWRGGAFPVLRALMPVMRPASPDAVGSPLALRRRLFVGGRTQLVDVVWADRRYLLAVHEGGCTVIDSTRCTHSDEPASQEDPS